MKGTKSLMLKQMETCSDFCIWIVIVLVFMHTGAASRPVIKIGKYAKLSMHNNYIGWGDQILRSTCHLHETATAVYSTKTIWFELRGAKTVDQENLTLAPYTKHYATYAILHYPLRHIDQSTFLVYLKCCVHLQPGNKSQCVDLTIHIGRRPRKPKVISFKVSNWSYMTFDWQPQTQPDTIYNTDTYAYWISYPSNNGEEWKKCENVSGQPGRCIIKANFTPDSTYDVKVTATNRLGSATSNIKRIDAATIVEPDPVCEQCIKVIGETSTTEALVEIKAPYPGNVRAPLLYFVKYQCKFDMIPKELNVTNSSAYVQVRLKDLYAGQYYNFSVRTIPAKYGGFWSKTTSVTPLFATKEDVPGKAPEVCDGCYETIENTEKDKRTVIMYWKQVPERQAHGNITAHQVQIMASTSQVKPVAGNKYWVELRNLTKDVPYQITVNALTEKGANDSLDLRVITIPASTVTLPDAPDTVSVIQINNTHSVIKWLPVEGATHYTVLWCIQPAQLADLCQGSPNWKQIDGTQSELLMVKGAHDLCKHYRVAVSSQKNGISSGLVWNNHCCYRAQREPTVPKIRQLTRLDKNSISVVLQANTRGCYGNDAYIVRYIINVTLQDSEDSKACSNKIIKTVVVASGQDKYIIGDLEGGHTYCFKVVSVAYGGQTASSMYSSHTVIYLPKSGFSPATITGIICACLVMIFLFTIGFITCCRYCAEVQDKMKLHIEVPGKLSIKLDSEGYTIPSEGTRLMYIGEKPSIGAKDNEYKEPFHLNGVRNWDRRAPGSQAVTNGAGPPRASFPPETDWEDDQDEYTKTSHLLSEMGGVPGEPVAVMTSGPDSGVPFVSLPHSDEVRRILEMPASPIKVDIDDTMGSTGDAGSSQLGSSGNFVNAGPETFNEQDEMLKTPAAPMHGLSENGTPVVQCPRVIEASDVQCPRVIEASDVQCPRVIEASDVQCPRVIEASDVQCPRVIEASDVQCPRVIEAGVEDVEAAQDSESTDQQQRSSTLQQVPKVVLPSENVEAQPEVPESNSGQAPRVMSPLEKAEIRPKVPESNPGHVIFPGDQPVTLVNYEDSGTGDSEYYTDTRNLLCEMGGSGGLSGVSAPNSTFQALQPSRELQELLKTPAAPIQVDYSDDSVDNAVVEGESDGYAPTSLTNEDLLSPVSPELGQAADHMTHIDTGIITKDDKVDTKEENQMESGVDETVAKSDSKTPNCGSDKKSAISNNFQKCGAFSNAAQKPLHGVAIKLLAEDNDDTCPQSSTSDSEHDDDDYSSANFTGVDSCI